MRFAARLARLEAKLNPSLVVASSWVYFLRPGDAGRYRDVVNDCFDGTVYRVFIRPDAPRPFPPNFGAILYKDGINPNPRPGPDVEPKPDEDPDPDEKAGDLDPETQQWVRDELRPCLTPAQQRVVDQARYVVILS